MAINIINSIPAHLGAFAENQIKLNVYNENPNQLTYTLLDPNDITQFSVKTQQKVPVFGQFTNSTQIHLFASVYTTGLYTSMFPSYDNPLLTNDPFHQVNPTKHQKLIRDKIESATSNVQQDRMIYKATDVKYLTEWGQYKNYLAMTSLNDRIVRRAFKGMRIPISYYTIENLTNYVISMTNQNGTSMLGASNTPHNFRVCSFILNNDFVYNSIELPYSHITLELITDFKQYKNKKVLYFLNGETGGWDWFCGIDFEETDIVEKSQYTRYVNIDSDMDMFTLVHGAYTETKIIGHAMTSDHSYYLKELVKSPIVLDEDGNRVRITNTNFNSKYDGIKQPEFTYQTLKKKNVTY